MKILDKVSAIEVKHAFVAAQKMRRTHKNGKKYLPQLTKEEFSSRLWRAKIATNKLSEIQLDKIIANEYQKRAYSYNNSDWYLAQASTKEIGVWRRAGGLPARWTCCSLNQTADFFKKGLNHKSILIRARSKQAIPRIMTHADVIRKEKALFPIVFSSGTGTCGRKFCRKRLVGDIDDGCMRSIALAMSGLKTLNIYFGKPKKTLNSTNNTVQ